MRRCALGASGRGTPWRAADCRDERGPGGPGRSAATGGEQPVRARPGRRRPPKSLPRGTPVATSPPPSHASFFPQVGRTTPRAVPPGSRSPGSSLHGVRLPPLPGPESSRATGNRSAQVGRPRGTGPNVASRRVAWGPPSAGSAVGGGAAAARGLSAALGAPWSVSGKDRAHSVFLLGFSCRRAGGSSRCR